MAEISYFFWRNSMNLQILEKKEEDKEREFCKIHISLQNFFFFNFYIKIKNAAINMRYILIVFIIKSHQKIEMLKGSFTG